MVDLRTVFASAVRELIHNRRVSDAALVYLAEKHRFDPEGFRCFCDLISSPVL